MQMTLLWCYDGNSSADMLIYRMEPPSTAPPDTTDTVFKVRLNDTNWYRYVLQLCRFVFIYVSDLRLSRLQTSLYKHACRQVSIHRHTSISVVPHLFFYTESKLTPEPEPQHEPEHESQHEPVLSPPALQVAVDSWQSGCQLAFCMHLGDIVDGLCPKDQSLAAIQKVRRTFPSLSPISDDRSIQQSAITTSPSTEHIFLVFTFLFMAGGYFLPEDLICAVFCQKILFVQFIAISGLCAGVICFRPTEQACVSHDW